MWRTSFSLINMEDDQKENAARPVSIRIPRSPSKHSQSMVLTELHCAAANLKTPTKPCENNSDPWTPTANLKMLISAASPEIRNREREILEEQFSGDELEKTMPSRKEKSLGLLCHKFLKRYPDYPNPAVNNSICLDEVAGELSVERRRIYDIVNVLESLHMVSRLAKNKYIWHGRKNLHQTFAVLRRVGEENKYAEQIQHLKKREQEEMDLQDEALIPKSLVKQQEICFVELPGLEFRAASVNSRKEKSLRVMSQRFVMLFLVSTPQIVSLDIAAKILIGEDQLDDLDKSKFKTKIRRLYDIANVLSSLNLIKKVHVTEERGRKPAFQWTGPETSPDNQDCSPTSALHTSIAVDLRSPKENCAKNLFSSRGKQSFTRHQSLIKLAKSIENDRRKINSAPSSPVKSGDPSDGSMSVPSKMAQLAAICKEQLDQAKDQKKMKLKVPRGVLNSNAKVLIKPQSQQSSPFSPVLFQALPIVQSHSPAPYAIYMQSPHTNLQAQPVLCSGRQEGDRISLQGDGKNSATDRPAENEFVAEKCARKSSEHESGGYKRLKASPQDDLSERMVHSGYLIPVQLATMSNDPGKDQATSTPDPKILTSPITGVFPLKVMFSPCVGQTAQPAGSSSSPSPGIFNFTLQNKDLISPPCGSAQPVTISPRNGKPDDMQAAKVLNYKHLSPIPYHGQPFTLYALQQQPSVSLTPKGSQPLNDSFFRTPGGLTSSPPDSQGSLLVSQRKLDVGGEE
ncbi:transcription factor E2F8 [Hyla sarda]|uniref:transcription factor E2F8 n=1 Tax=Hyla sarda TaxID=327740 RepID=UPI0024C26F57|nr:transcription factor E2F8 [Hyla sarda]XP_056383758.1 transcription factor E2F8 [Hyla sarda]XP_056383759.1 transcription factor E2F8 [Hyla sarda]XP_056383760.1 transcription factor E2F8 [Hyla sarda]